MSRRPERVADLVRSELSRILLREARDPRARLATITRVEVSADLSHARVAVSALGTEEEREGCVAALQRAQGFLRSRLAAGLNLRLTPELHFHLDRGTDHSLRIADLLKDLDVDPS